MQTRYIRWPTETKFQSLKNVDYLVIHHTASTQDVPIEEVDRWHKQRGFIGVGYHFLIRRDGSLEGGRPEWAMGAHVKNYNDRSLGVALNGDFMVQMPTPQQMVSLIALLKELQARYPAAKVVVHRHLRPTECPGVNFPWDELQSRLRSDTLPPNIEPWAKDTVEKLVRAGWLTNPEQLTREQQQVFVVLDRAGVFELARRVRTSGEN